MVNAFATRRLPGEIQSHHQRRPALGVFRAVYGKVQPDVEPGLRARLYGGCGGAARADRALLGTLPGRFYQARLQALFTANRHRMEAVEVEAGRGAQRIWDLLQRRRLRHAGVAAGRAAAVRYNHAAVPEHGRSRCLCKTASRRRNRTEVANTFAVDKNYHPGYAQNWTTSIQETFGRSYVVQIAYNGIKGTRSRRSATAESCARSALRSFRCRAA